MAQVVNDLVTRFGFDGSVAPLHEYNDALTGSIQLMSGMLAGLAAMSGAFAAWADGVLGGVDSLDALAASSGVAVERIQELSYAAEQSQSSAGALQSSLAGLRSSIASAAQQGSEDFARLGISIRDANGQLKSADTVLDDVRRRLSGMDISVGERANLAGALGIDESLVQLLGKTDAEMAALSARAREFGILTAEQTEQAAEYKKSMNSVWFSLNSVKQLIAVGVGPELGRLADGFAQLVADNKDWIVEGVQATVEWVGHLFDALDRLAPVLAVLAAGFGAAWLAAGGFAAIMGVILSPVALIVAGVAALLLVVDDLIVAFNGGQSVIADFFQEFLGVDIVPVLHGMVDGFLWMVEQVKGLLGGLWDYWTGMWLDVWSGIKAVGGLFGFGGDTTTASGVPISAPATGSVASTVDNRSVSQRNEFKIVTSDPKAAASAIGDTLQRQLGTAERQLGLGGR